MDVRLESSEGPPVASPSQAIDHFAKQTRDCQTQWVQRLADDPDAFTEIEREIDEYYRQGAGHLVAALLGKVASQPPESVMISVGNGRFSLGGLFSADSASSPRRERLASERSDACMEVRAACRAPHE